jgi:hypothetical protein
MIKDSSVVTCDKTHQGFVLQKQPVRSPKTAVWYPHYVARLDEGANIENRSLDQFTKRRLNAYLARRSALVKPTPRKCDAVATKTFVECCCHTSSSPKTLCKALIRSEPEKLFQVPHYEEHPAVLVRLEALNVDELTVLLTESWAINASAHLVKTWP